MVISTPSVWPYSGWPGVFEPQVRSAFRSSSSRPSPREVELHVLGQRAVAGGEDEAVAPEPGVVGRVAAHDLLEEEVGGGRKAHRGAGVPVPDLLDGVGREYARRVDRAIVDGFPLQIGHEVLFLPIVTASGTVRPRPAGTLRRGSAQPADSAGHVERDAGLVEPAKPGAQSSVYGFGGLCDGG